MESLCLNPRVSELNTAISKVLLHQSVARFPLARPSGEQTSASHAYPLLRVELMACTSTSCLQVTSLLKGLGSLRDGSVGRGNWNLAAHKSTASNINTVIS